jgi:hypothetical protein
MESPRTVCRRVPSQQVGQGFYRHPATKILPISIQGSLVLQNWSLDAGGGLAPERFRDINLVN